MEQYNQDSDDLGRQLGVATREWRRITREFDDLAAHWSAMAEKLLPGYSINPDQHPSCIQMKGNASGRGFSLYFAPFMLNGKMFGQIVVTADSGPVLEAAEAARLLIDGGGAIYDKDGSLLHGQESDLGRYTALCNIFARVLAVPL